MLVPHMTQLHDSHLLRGIDSSSFLPFAFAFGVGADGVDVAHGGASVGAGAAGDRAVGVGLLEGEGRQLVGRIGSVMGRGVMWRRDLERWQEDGWTGGRDSCQRGVYYLCAILQGIFGDVVLELFGLIHLGDGWGVLKWVNV